MIKVRKAHAERGTVTVYYRILDADIGRQFSESQSIRSGGNTLWIPVGTLVDMAHQQVERNVRRVWKEARRVYAGQYTFNEKEEDHG